MIEVKVIESEDISKLGNFKFFMEKITIGSDIENNLFISSSAFPKSALKLFIEDNKFYSEAHKDIDYYHVNGKKTTGRKLLKVGDSVKISSSVFEVINFLQDPIESKSEILNKRVEQLQNEGSPLIEIMQSMVSDEREL